MAKNHAVSQSDFILQAATKGDLTALKNINDLSQELIEQFMLISAEKGYFKIFKYLAEKADKERTEWTDYQEISAREGHVNIFAYLNEYKKDYVYDDWGSFMEDAIIRGDFEMVKFLDRGNMDEYVVLAIDHRRHDIAKYALEHGNIRFMDWEEPMVAALEQKYLDLAEIITGQFDDINWKDVYAEIEGYCSDVVAAYIKNKIKLNVE